MIACSVTFRSVESGIAMISPILFLHIRDRCDQKWIRTLGNKWRALWSYRFILIAVSSFFPHIARLKYFYRKFNLIIGFPCLLNFELAAIEYFTLWYFFNS